MTTDIIHVFLISFDKAKYEFGISPEIKSHVKGEKQH